MVLKLLIVVFLLLFVERCCCSWWYYCFVISIDAACSSDVVVDVSGCSGGEVGVGVMAGSFWCFCRLHI